jgi:glycogen debranching enzyme
LQLDGGGGFTTVAVRPRKASSAGGSPAASPDQTAGQAFLLLRVGVRFVEGANERGGGLDFRQAISPMEMRVMSLSQVPAGGGSQRLTPLNPFPQAKADAQIREDKAYPPEVGADSIAILEGSTFMCSSALGDIPPRSIGGLMHKDTRFLSRWELKLAGRVLSLLKSRVVDYYSASFFLTNPELPAVGLRANSVAVRRMRFVGNGLVEQIVALNAASVPIELDLTLGCGADFADLFEVKSAVRDRAAHITRTSEASALCYRYDVPGFLAETVIRVKSCCIAELDPWRVVSDTSATVSGDEIGWRVELARHQALVATIEVSLRTPSGVLVPVHHDFGETQLQMPGPLEVWLAERPQFESDSVLLKNIVDKSIVDLAALRISGEVKGEAYVMPAAGLPWFMTLFGRDTIIAGLQTLSVGPELARGALHLLAASQGKVVDDFRDEEPGKILHEIRSGELTVLGEKPHDPYYGTADATPLFLILMENYWRVTLDNEFVRKRWNTVLAALDWIDHYGDRDGDGYVEYATKSPQGLGNQCWKDSWDGIQFGDGTIPWLPIATAEIQGYVYDAKCRVANMAKALFKDSALAARLEREADELRTRFNRDFWSDERGGYFVVGLDGDKRQIDSMTSNMGHLLWSGIVPPERAGIIAGHLMSDKMFSGWGIRTLSTEDRGYNPLGYHTGTIWPHDNALIALGLARYGFRDEANRIGLAHFEAAAYSDYRLPEAFAGFQRSVKSFPVPYPTACSPQAWATGAPFQFLQAMLGEEVRDGEIRLVPRIPEQLGRIKMRRLHALGKLWDIETIGDKAHVRLSG